MFEHIDLVIECDVQMPAQILCRDVALVPVCAFAPAPSRAAFSTELFRCAHKRPRSTTRTLFLSRAPVRGPDPMTMR